MAKLSVCKVHGCRNSGKIRKGYCEPHYCRFRRHGDPLGGRAAPGVPQKWLMDNASHTGDECLLWPFSKMTDGYAQVRWRGGVHRASRVMCYMAHGLPDCESLEAAHTCGNGHLACVNPRHLYWATKSQNLMDRVEHGTHNRGERAFAAKLKAEQVIEIKKLISESPVKEIAKKYGVSEGAIYQIKKGRSWAWLTDESQIEGAP